MANTTYLQDYFFGKMYEELFAPEYAKNSHMLALGDHSWPTEIHKGNNYNLNAAFQENFVTSMAVIPAESAAGHDRYRIRTEVSSLRSYLDIVPTVMEMYRLRQNNYYGKSFFKDFGGDGSSVGDKRCVVSVQPFSGGYIAVVNYPIKHIFDLRKGIVTVYNLAEDPTEMNPVQEAKIKPEHLDLLEGCLRSLRDKSVNPN